MQAFPQINGSLNLKAFKERLTEPISCSDSYFALRNNLVNAFYEPYVLM